MDSRKAKPVIGATLLLLTLCVAGYGIQVETDSCLDRTVPVGVYTSRGQRVAALTAANFKGSVGRKPVQVRAATYDQSPRRIVILIDVSGSMTVPTELAFGLTFARDFISMAPPQDSLALLTFDNRIEDSIPFDLSRTALLAEVDKLQKTDWSHVKGFRKTALRDALINALKLLKTPSLGDAICVVTDGGDNASQTPKPKLQALLQSAGVRVYALLPTWYFGRSRTTEEAAGPSDMHDLATATNGDFQVIVPSQIRNNSLPASAAIAVSDSDREELLLVAKSFYREIFSFNKLEVRLPEPLSKARKWNLEVVEDSGKPNKRLHVVYPHRFAPCTQGDAQWPAFR